MNFIPDRGAVGALLVYDISKAHSFSDKNAGIERLVLSFRCTKEHRQAITLYSTF